MHLRPGVPEPARSEVRRSGCLEPTALRLSSTSRAIARFISPINSPHLGLVRDEMVGLSEEHLGWQIAALLAA